MTDFNLSRLYEILGETTVQLRRGAVLEGSPELVRQAEEVAAGERDSLTAGGVLEVYAMPHEREASDLELVDLEFIKVGINMEAAERLRPDLLAILNAYPQPERLAGGPSYIEVGGEIGDQGAAFQLFALGKALGLWSVITPATMGFTGQEARDLAGSGFVMISGYRAPAIAVAAA